ncbi:MAG: MBL fold metallo-hydrolase [Dyadobacter sp.]
MNLIIIKLETMKYFAQILLTFCIVFPRLLHAQDVNRPSHLQYQVGNIEVVALSDGTVDVDADKLIEPKFDGQVNKLLQEKNLRNPIATSINSFLIKIDNRLILVDVGAGELLGGQTNGLLIAALKSAGHSADQVTDVLITHIHLDHTGGLLSRGKRAFPSAKIHVNKKEIGFWQAHQKPQQSEAFGISINRPAYFVLEPYLDANQVQIFESNTELFPGIRAIEMIGHSPGHTLYELTSNTEKMLFWGDLIHIAPVQLENFDLGINYDLDKRKAAIQRGISYKAAANEGYLIAASHITFPGIGRIINHKKGFNWAPVAALPKPATK